VKNRGPNTVSPRRPEKPSGTSLDVHATPISRSSAAVFDSRNGWTLTRPAVVWPPKTRAARRGRALRPSLSNIPNS
jgi:hypothetical protein